MASFAFNGSDNGSGTGLPPGDSDLFEEGQPWYRSTALWIGLAVVVAALLFISGRAWNQDRIAHKTDAFLDLYAQAPDNAARLKLLENADVPDAAADLLIVGSSFLEQGDAASADKAFSLAESRFGGSPLASGAWLAQGQLLAAQGKGDEAASALQKVVSSPDRAAQGYRPLALLALAGVKAAKNDTGGARQALQELLAKYPESAFVPEARSQLGLLPASS